MGKGKSVNRRLLRVIFEEDEMNILVQKDVAKPSSRRTFARISTEALTLKDVIHSLSGIIDDERNGYCLLPFMDARSESLQRLDIYTSLRKQRADKAYILSNGRNTIYVLDYVVRERKIYHDPVLCIIGPDAEKIANYVLKQLSKILLSKTYNIELNENAIRDFSRLTGYERTEVIKQLSDTFKEAEIALKMRLLREVTDERVPSAGRKLSEEIIKDVESKAVSREPIDLRSIIPFGITLLLMIMLLIILLRV